jgi:hypothetical protein
MPSQSRKDMMIRFLQFQDRTDQNLLQWKD